jgi:hypothetical protein
MVTMNSMINELQFCGYRKLNNEYPYCETFFLPGPWFALLRKASHFLVGERTFDSSACVAEFIGLDCTGSPESIIAEAQHGTFPTTRTSKQASTSIGLELSAFLDFCDNPQMPHQTFNCQW